MNSVRRRNFANLEISALQQTKPTSATPAKKEQNSLEMKKKNKETH